ncbi:MAG: hypothetical protein A2Z57_03355 [Planctomycetes bacterium RIFCSPHIGHO2_12_39_6]|nr:MAG: hypothetical protein A2Z57_03355 [Planctomycetes bacterium RIFCSPHIGHO2_12_39_6]
MKKKIIKGDRLQRLQLDIQKWSDSAFGKNRNSLPMVYHLKKEIEELITALLDVCGMGVDVSDEALREKYHRVVMEYADCFMLLIDSAAHFPIGTGALLNAVEKKLEINKKRKWGEPDKNGVVEHIKMAGDL